MKIVTIDNAKEGQFTHMFHCPGCKSGHGFSDKIWTYNNNPDKPTIRASILVTYEIGVKVCHSFVTDGKIEFLSDSYHELAGQTVELPEL